jgi:uncharacterized protein (TIGR02996 family)
MTTLASLLRAVCEDPADDFCRLVLADWLDDNGEPARAEFVRAQVRMTQLRSLITDERDNIGLGWSLPKEQASEMLRLSRCEARLLTGSVGLWSAWEGCPGTRAEFLHPHDFHEQRQADAMLRFLFRRGFVAEVRCRLADWLAHGKGIIARQPVEAVVLADREPAQSASGWWWSSPRSVGGHPQSILPEPLFSYLSGVRPNYSVLSPSYPSREDALSALSTAAVSWARAQADLPPLPREES